MNPYRSAHVQTFVRAKRRKPFSFRKAMSWAVVVATIGPVFAQLEVQAQLEAHNFDPTESTTHFLQMGWLPCLAPIGVIALIIAVLPVPQDDAKARLCRILRSRGEAGTAFGVSIGWIPLRLSKKRVERNARAVERFVQQRRRERYPWIKWSDR